MAWRWRGTEQCRACGAVGASHVGGCCDEVEGESRERVDMGLLAARWFYCFDSILRLRTALNSPYGPIPRSQRHTKSRTRYDDAALRLSPTYHDLLIPHPRPCARARLHNAPHDSQILPDSATNAPQPLVGARSCTLDLPPRLLLPPRSPLSSPIRPTPRYPLCTFHMCLRGYQTA